jgi:TonB family protein
VTRRFLLIAILAFSALAAAVPARAQASLTKAKELYASANYDEALTMLNTLSYSSNESDAASVAMYRVLCLVAVGRTGEVDAAIDRLVSQYPLYRPASDELSPRMQKAVSSARVRLLPNLVQKRYEESKSAYDRGDFAASKAGFKWVLTALADPDISYLAMQSPLADLKTLSTGFVDLSEKALVPTPPPPAAPLVPTAVTITPPPVKPARDLKRVFSGDDTDVVAPVTTKQPMPRYPGGLATAASGVLELIIDANGAVESARMVEPVSRNYDQLLLTAAKKWQYQPAQLDGTPVRYMKRIQISLAPSTDTLPRGR